MACVTASVAAASAAPAAIGFPVGSRIPTDFPVTVSALDGSSVLLKDRIPPARADAQAVLLVFWATWCAPCIEEIPTLRSLEDFYRPRGFRVVGVGMNEGGDTAPLVKAATNRHGINYEVLFDAKGAIKAAFAVPGIPWSVLVDRDGIVRWAGPALPKDASARIRSILTPKEDRGSR
jgi:thiol-disulfide isomerase/thioredoxin